MTGLDLRHIMILPTRPQLLAIGVFNTTYTAHDFYNDRLHAHADSEERPGFSTHLGNLLDHSFCAPFSKYSRH